MAGDQPPLPVPRIEAPDEWKRSWKKMPRRQVVGGYMRESNPALSFLGESKEPTLGTGCPQRRAKSATTKQRSTSAMKDLFLSVNADVQRKIERTGVAAAPSKTVKRPAPTGMAAVPTQGLGRRRPESALETTTTYSALCKQHNKGDHRNEPTNRQFQEADPYIWNGVGPFEMTGSGNAHSGTYTGVQRDRSKRFYKEKEHPKLKVHVDQGSCTRWADWVFSTSSYKPN